ncbi:MAG: hypothetical protein ACLTBR_02075 [Anaerostipes sp.]|uniref:hypothetical protein n=1 Tax=Anaerostipes sp. TaxID=1872530 RepID=UPI0039914B8A
MNKCKKIAILICVFLTALNIGACGKEKKEEVVNTEKSTADKQESNTQEVENTTVDLSGDYVCPTDDSTLSITLKSDGSYSAELNLFRLTSIDDFKGTYENGTFVMTGTDSAGNPITAELAFSGEQVTLIFTDSTWEYLENGTKYVFNKE